MCTSCESKPDIDRSPVTARSKAWVCGRSLGGIMGSNPARGVWMSVVSVVFRQVEVSATS